MKDKCCGENKAGEGRGGEEGVTVFNKVVGEGLWKKVAVGKDWEEGRNCVRAVQAESPAGARPRGRSLCVSKDQPRGRSGWDT